jgi:hypothetical protein
VSAYGVRHIGVGVSVNEFHGVAEAFSHLALGVLVMLEECYTFSTYVVETMLLFRWPFCRRPMAAL